MLPPPKKLKNSLIQISKSAVALAILSVFITPTYAEALNIGEDKKEIGRDDAYVVSSKQEFGSLNINVEPIVENSSFAININSSSGSLTINGPSVIK